MAMWDYTTPKKEEIADGDYRLKIFKAEYVQSKTGKMMLRLCCNISGYETSINYHIILDPNNRERTNRNLQSMFYSFGIPEGDMNVTTYVEKEGAGRIERDPNNPEYSNIKYLIYGKRKDDLPPFEEKIPF